MVNRLDFSLMVGVFIALAALLYFGFKPKFEIVKMPAFFANAPTIWS